MKIVVNKCYGGFGLSPIAIKEYLKLKGKDCFFYKKDYKTGMLNRVSVEVATTYDISLTKDYGEQIKEDWKSFDADYFYYNDIERTDLDLIKVVETLGESISSGSCAKLKVIEIFLLLSVISTTNHEKRSSYRKQQVDIVKAVNEYISTQFMKRITIDSLSEQFDIPTSTLKRCFKGVYGTTIHHYLKECRINAAKRLLQESDRSILEIANAVGYENGSKFTSAFKEATGITPSAYRKV